MPNIDLSILNQRQTPAFYADVFANRPAAGFVGRIFVSTNTFAFYRDNGTGWDLIGGPGTGTITGTGTANSFTIFTGASTIGDSSYLTQAANAINVANADIYLPANNTVGGTNYGLYQVMATNDYWKIYGNTQSIDAGELVFEIGDNGSSAALDRFRFTVNDGDPANDKDLFVLDYDYSYFNTSVGINTPTPTAAFDVHSGVSVIAQLNQTVATNNSLLAFQNSNTGLWRIGNFYNAGANDWGIFDVVGAIQPVTVKKTTGQVLIGTSTVGSGKLVVASSTGDNGVQIVGASAPSLRIDNAESGPTKRAGLGISTATNNFIQGSADRDFCMFNGSTTASPILFGIYDTTNVQEAARISAAKNFLVGTVTDPGYKIAVNGNSYLGTTSTMSNTLFSTGGQYGLGVSEMIGALIWNVNLATIFTNYTFIPRALSITIQIIGVFDGTNGTSVFANCYRSINGTWLINTISTSQVGPNGVTTITGSGTTITITFNSVAYGSVAINIINGG